MEEKDNNKKRLKINWKRFSLQKLNRKYDFLMSHDETGNTMLKFRLNLLNLILVIIGMALLLIIITTYIIAFTPLREYIPGYTDSNLNREVYQLNLRADSLVAELQKKDVYFQNLQKVIEGYDFSADTTDAPINIYEPLPSSITDTIVLRKSVQDSLLRAEFEAQNQYNLFGEDLLSSAKRNPSVKNFFAPITGRIIKDYDPQAGHIGIDIISEESQIINATLDGTVVFSIWSIEDGYSLGIQHEDGYFSIYKHNSTLLKNEGDFVKAGEAVAILGQSGENATQKHLHFELWHNGISLNPSEYMRIENIVHNN